MYAAVPTIAPGALSADVAPLRHGLPSSGVVSSATQFRQAEVEHLHGAVVADHDVGRLQIAMDDAARVRGRQRVGDGNGDAQHLAQAHAVARDERIEALAAHVLHHDEVDAVGRLDLVNRDDVRDD